jgi:NAD(P)H dehydrogenase (quinone)
MASEADGLTHIRHVAAVVTYDRPRYVAWGVGDPPRRIVTRYLFWRTSRRSRLCYLAPYQMNVATPTSCARFIRRVLTTRLSL